MSNGFGFFSAVPVYNAYLLNKAEFTALWECIWQEDKKKQPQATADLL